MKKETLVKKQSLSNIIRERTGLNHAVKEIRYYNNNILCSEICADYTAEEVFVENSTDNLVFTAFGVKNNPSWDDYMQFLSSRCIPEQRDHIHEYLNALGLDEYDPLEIIRKTGGRMAEDNQSLTITEIN